MNDSRTVATIPQVNQPSFSELERMAVSVAKSGMFAVKTTEGALTLMLIAQAEGIHPAQAMMDYDVIAGKPALKSAAMLARFQRSGGKVQWITSTDECVSGKFSHPAGGELTVSWDTARIKTAGLDGKEMHKKFPLQMKRARCISEGVRAVAPQSIPVGVYTVEETRDMEEEIDITPRPTIDAAVEIATATPMDSEVLTDLLKSIDVCKTMKQLTPTFGNSYRVAKEAGDEAAKLALKAAYDAKKLVLEAEQAI